MQRVQPMEELELDTAPAQRLVHGGDDHVAHPRRHLPEDRALVLEQHETGQEHGQARAERRALGVGVDVSEHQVVQATHQREIEDVGMCAVALDPVVEILVVDGAEAARVGHQIVGEDAPNDRRHQRQQQPGSLVVRSILDVENIAHGVEGLARARRPTVVPVTRASASEASAVTTA